MSHTVYAILAIAVMAVVTALIRFLPFLVFRGDREIPPVISYLGKVLPYASIGMLVVYCLKGISFTNFPFGLPEILASALVVGLHVWKKNTLLSIFAGTVFYMVLVQMVF